MLHPAAAASLGTSAGAGSPLVEKGKPVSSDLLTLLPHRPPFRFVDSIEACDPGRSARGRHLVTGDEWYLPGHFPGNPIVPGVLVLEALAQVGAVAVLADARYAERLPLFGGAENVRFRRTVRPGDVLALEVEVERLSARGGWGRGRATVEGETACEARIFFIFD